jgi:hypothetical protein
MGMGLTLAAVITGADLGMIVGDKRTVPMLAHPVEQQ